ncbi:RING zinc finger-containing protein [Tieghemostelium lacteum]|uniref:E3 ubiquitin protein ligase n=1 Tax=Tieghemostelium lacteum TaxID=361077 RepID=A0A151ZGA6_TIELA|nr:RING zinc finger-containing protein [Tieghemostelium lacteum]|eukprot:KYQ93008.1 RING zinc finger-containing protein [Tieghemostelium lacteum]
METGSEDRKRKEVPGGNDNDGKGSSNKRVLSSSEASVQLNNTLEPKDQNLLLFQNRAMKVRVEEQKLELNDRDRKIGDLNSKIHNYDETVSYLCRTWDQLNDGLNLLLLRVNFENEMEELLPKNLNLKESYQFLSNYISEPQSLEEGSSSIDQILQQRVQKTQLVFTKISGALEKERNLSNVIFRLLKSQQLQGNDCEKLLKDENDKLSKQNQMFQLVYDRLHVQYKTLSDQSQRFLDQIGTYQSEIKQLKSELERSNDELVLERRRVIKLQDESLRLNVKIPSPVINPNQLNSNQQLQGSTNSLNSSMGGMTPQGTPKTQPEQLVGGPMPMSISRVDEDQLQELSKLAELRLAEARKLREEKANLFKELQQLQIEIKVIPEDRILQSMQYQVLRQRMQIITEELDIHRQQCQKLQNELTQATISRRIDREQIESFENTRRQNLERRLSQLEVEIIELKSEKEKLIEMIEQRNPNIPSQEYIQESRILLDAKDKDIQKLTKELEKLKQLKSSSDDKMSVDQPNGNNSNSNNKNIIEVKSLITKLIELTSVNQDLLNNEKKLQQQEHNLFLTLDNVIKNSSENTTELGELQTNDKKLSGELEILKKQFSEIEQLKNKQQLEIQQLNSTFKEKIKDLENSNMSYSNNSNNNNNSGGDDQKQELEALIMEIDSMGKEYEQMQEQNTRLVKQLSEREDTYAQLMAENIKSQQSIRNAKEAQQSMEEKVIRTEEKMKSQNEIMLKLDEKAKLVQNQLSKITEDLHLCTFELEKNKRLVREFNAQAIELRTQLDHTSSLNIELKKKADDSIFALEREIDKAKRLDEEKQSLKKKLEKANIPSNSSTGSSSISPEDEIKIINQRLRCTICNDRQKNTVIAKCFHVFCKECIYSNIDTRKRRCPGCKRPFSENDVHQIYL